jgi:hypothetical protein
MRKEDQMAEKSFKQVGVYFDNELHQRLRMHQARLGMEAVALGETPPSTSKVVQDMVRVYLDGLDAVASKDAGKSEAAAQDRDAGVGADPEADDGPGM